MALYRPADETCGGFRFRGGNPVLDLAATLAARLKPTPRELLKTPEDLDRWLAEVGFVNDGALAGARDLEVARTLREAIYDLATSDGGDARATINRIATGPPAVPRFDRDGDAIVTGAPAAMLVTLAREAILLLGGSERGRVRQCAGEGCAILYLDQSRKGDRRWCSMAGCGNKAKVADFRKRARQVAG